MTGFRPNLRVSDCLRSGVALFALALTMAGSTVLLRAAQANGDLRVLKTIHVVGDGRWDYLAVDSAARRLYVSHGTEVDVLSANTGQVIGRIPDTPGVHGIALVPTMHRAFITQGLSGHVAIVDTKTLHTLRQVPTGKNPDAIIYDPATRRIFANNGGSESTTAIDAVTGDIVGTLDLGGSPEYAAADGAGHIYINLEEQNETIAIDSQNLRVDQRWSLSPCMAPTSMAIDRRSRRLFIGCRNHFMAVLNIDTGRVVTALPIGDHVDATVFDPERHLIFCSNADGTLNVFRQLSADEYRSVQTLKTALGARTMAFDASTHRIFLPTADLDTSAPLKPGQKAPVKPRTFRLIVVGD
jgi:DNA-binding beta-propeller fold protein YncE